MRNVSKNEAVSKLVENVIVSLILSAALFFGAASPVYASGTDSSQSDTDSIFDVAIVIDISGSMKHSDPNHNAKEGAKMFLDMSMRNESKVAIISYGYDAKLLGKGTLSSNADKEQLKNLIESIEYPEKNGTDTGEALDLAKSTLEKYGEEGHQKCIILFTDGDVEWAEKDNNNDANEKSVDICKKVSLWGDKKNGDCPLYILGLNAKVNGKNTISKTGKNLIETLAANSGGKSKVITNVNQITDFYASIFGEITDAEMISGKEYTATGEWQSASVLIPNSSVKKANIMLLTSAKVDNVKLTDPHKNEKKFNSTDCVLSREKTYSIVELNNPEKGNWTLRFKAPKDTKIKTSFFFLYDDMVSVHTVKAKSGSNSDAYINQPVTVECYLKSNNTKVLDPDVYKDIVADVKVINTETDELAYTFNLTFDEKKMAMEGQFTPDKFGKYSVTTTLRSNSFHRENGPTEVKVIDHDPLAIAPINDFSLRVGSSQSFVLGNYFKDPDGLRLEYTLNASDGTILDASCDVVSGSDVVMNFSAKQRGTDSFTLTVSDPNGNKAIVNFRVKVKTLWDIICPWLIAFGVLLIISVFAIVLKNYMKQLNGYMYIIDYDDTAFTGGSYGDDYLSIPYSRSHSENLMNIIQRFATDKEQTADGQLITSIRNDELSKVLSAIVLTGAGGHKDYAMSLSYRKGKNTAEVTMDGKDLSKRKQVLRISDFSSEAFYSTHSIVIKLTNHCITINFQYTPRS